MPLDNTKSNAGGGKRVAAPSRPDIAALIENDPGGSTKDDIYRQCLLRDVEQCNWRMRRSLKTL